MPTYRLRNSDGSEYCQSCRESVKPGATRCPHCTSVLWPPEARRAFNTFWKGLGYTAGLISTILFLAAVGARWRGHGDPVALAVTGSATALFWVTILWGFSPRGGLSSFTDYLIASHLQRYYRKWGVLGFIAGVVLDFVLITLVIAPTKVVAPIVAASLAPVGLDGPRGATLVYQAIAACGYLVLLYGYYRAIVKIRSDEPQTSTSSGGTSSSRSGSRRDEDLGGEWKHETAEAERAHRRAQQQEPPVELGQQVSFPVAEVDRREQQVQGDVERFRIFVDQDVPPDVEKGQMICVQIMHWATNDAGDTVGAHGRFVDYGRC